MSAVADYLLTLSCPDRPGIVAAVTGALAAASGDILEAQQFGDRETGRFFLRIDLSIAGFEDNPFSKQAWPALTTARQSTRDIGQHAALRLMDLLRQQREDSPHVTMPNESFVPELVVRGSICNSTAIRSGLARLSTSSPLAGSAHAPARGSAAAAVGSWLNWRRKPFGP